MWSWNKKDWYVCNCGKNDRFEVNSKWLIQLNVSRWQPLFYKIQIKSRVFVSKNKNEISEFCNFCFIIKHECKIIRFQSVLEWFITIEKDRHKHQQGIYRNDVQYASQRGKADGHLSYITYVT